MISAKAAWNSSKRREARAAGLCITCCKETPQNGRSVCRGCSAKASQRTIRRRTRLRQSSELHYIVQAHERTGDLAREHHLYADAAQQYLEVLSLSAVVPADHLRISEKLAEMLSFGSDPGAANPLYDRLLTSYLPNPNDGVKIVQTLLGKVRQLQIDSKTGVALPILAQAIRVAELRGDAELLKITRLTMAILLSALARYQEAEKFLNAAGGITEEDDADTRVSYWVQRGFMEEALGKEAGTFESFERAIHVIKEHPDPYNETAVLGNYAFAAMRLGRTEFAKTCYERTLLTARRNNLVWCIPKAYLDYAWLLTKMGHYALAHEYLLDALSYASSVKTPIFDVVLASVGIPLALHMKDEKTLARCVRPNAIELAFLSEEPYRIGLIATAFARLYTEQGSHRKARSLLHRALGAVQHVQHAWDLPIEIARNGLTADIPHARQLLESRTALPCGVLSEAHLRLFDAFVAQRQGHNREAYAQARVAGARFDALHWNAYADLARSILPAPDTSVALTEREREVAALVLKGLTSRAIADALSISPNTVNSHVNSIMNRLGIHSRHQLAYILNVSSV